MNSVQRAVRRIDDWQQRHRAAAFTFAVFRKFADDQGNHLVALLAYFALLATFPLMLALVGVLGIVLRGDPALKDQIVDSSFGKFPVIGHQLHSQLGTDTLPHSGAALIIGIVGAILGGRGLANAFQHAMNTLWTVPKVDRPGFPRSYLRTFALLGLLGVGAILTAVTSSVVAGAGRLVGLTGLPVHIASVAVLMAVGAGLFLAAFRVATAKTVATRDLVPGAILSAVVWQALLSFAGLLIQHYLSHATAVAGTFGVVLGLVAWFGLQATVTIFVIEADVVRARRLWPRSLVQQPLTDADKRFLDAAADAETRRPEQRVEVEFSADPNAEPATGSTA